MKHFVRETLLLALLFTSCEGFNVTVPERASVGQFFQSQWNANQTDFNSNMTSTGIIGVVLIAPQTDISCPGGFGEVGFDPKQILDGYSTVKSSANQTSPLLFGPQKTGLHRLCAYANAPENFEMNSTQSGGGADPNLGILSLVYESPNFDVKEGNSREGNSNKTDNGPIVGGVLGGVAVICILIACFFYRKFRYQKKLNRFHREHQLLQQVPPPSILASTLVADRSSVHGAASPPRDFRSTGVLPAANRLNSHVPLGFDDTMQKSYHFPSVRSSPSSCSVPLPHEPELRAQHASRAGASNM
ncbi:hypothetical protein PM082_014924 [Marasmius tenuissimus]|nr:hypothetical protein PM082_014924 [Marasmius tenuissimus]